MRILVSIFALATIIGLYGCSEDFTVAAPYKPITTVSGILDQNDTAHYIRIQKAFMDETKSALNMSKEPDSSFYKNLSVKLYKYDSAQVRVLDSVLLYRVDMNSEADAYRKLDPISEQQFFQSPNYAYKFKDDQWTIPGALSSRNWYKLVITNLDNGLSDTSGYVGIINTAATRTLDGFYISEFQQAGYTLAFAKTSPTSVFKLNCYMPRNGRIAQGYIRFHYVDENVSSGNVVRKYVDFPFDSEDATTQSGSIFQLTVPNSNIYAFLGSSIEPLPANTNRYLDSCDLFVYAASPEIYYYNIINQGQSGGLTADNIQPNYTNFTSERVVGVLGSRGMRSYYNASIEKTTIDSIMLNPVTSGLGIRGISKD